MTIKSEDIAKLLKSKGLRVTPQRFAVFAHLLGRSDHPTVEQILIALNQDYPVSSQATVYTTLQALRKVGLVREVLLQEGVSRYDANVMPHHHFYCVRCHAIEDIPLDAFPHIDLSLVRSGLHPQKYEVVVEGICDRC